MTAPTETPTGRRSFLPREQWRRNQVAIVVAAAMVFLGFNLVMPFLPFYVESLGVHGVDRVALWSGIILSVSPLLASVLGPLWGRLADRVGMRIMVQRVLFTITLHWGLMYFATSVWHVLGLRILLGLFSGFGTMSVALVTHGCPRERIGRTVGTLQATQILSTAVGPFLGGILAQSIGIRQTFAATFALCVGALCFVLFLYRDTAVEDVALPAAPIIVSPAGPVAEGVRAVLPPSAADAPAPPRFRELLALPFFLPLLPLLFLVNMVDRSLGLLVPLAVASLLGRATGIEAVAGLVISAGAFASAASAFVLGRAAGGRSPLLLLLLAILAGSLLIVPMGFCGTLAPFALLRVLLGLAVGGAATLGYTLAGGVIPGNARASGYALLSSAAMLGGALGPILAGLLTSIDLRVSFLAGGAIYLGLTVHVALMRRRNGWAGAVAAPHLSGGGG